MVCGGYQAMPVLESETSHLRVEVGVETLFDFFSEPWLIVDCVLDGMHVVFEIYFVNQLE